MKPNLTIVGAGVTGLTAAIEAAERGWRVTVAEAHSRPGGRARSLAAPSRANTGPHAIYVDGPWWAWLERQGLTPPIVAAPRYASLVRAGGRLGPFPAELSEAIAALPAEAPVEESFRAWLLRHVCAKTAEAIVGLVFIFTYADTGTRLAHGPDDPGHQPRHGASADGGQIAGLAQCARGDVRPGLAGRRRPGLVPGNRPG